MIEILEEERAALKDMCYKCINFSRCMGLATSDLEKSQKQCRSYTKLENAIEDLEKSNEFIKIADELVLEIKRREENERENAKTRVLNASL